MEKYHPKEDNTLLTLKAAQIDEDEYFAQVVSEDVERILKEVKKAHSNDSENISWMIPQPPSKSILMNFLGQRVAIRSGLRFSARNCDCLMPN